MKIFTAVKRMFLQILLNLYEEPSQYNFRIYKISYSKFQLGSCCVVQSCTATTLP